jgi:hypothetical protein
LAHVGLSGARFQNGIENIYLVYLDDT